MEHDGNISIPSDLLDQPIFRYTRQQKIDMTSYFSVLDTATAPAVGCTIRLTNVNNKQEQSDWATLQSQASAANADLIARGTIHAHVHGLLYQPARNSHLSDTQTLYTPPQLQALIEKVTR